MGGMIKNWLCNIKLNVALSVEQSSTIYVEGFATRGVVVLADADKQQRDRWLFLHMAIILEDNMEAILW